MQLETAVYLLKHRVSSYSLSSHFLLTVSGWWTHSELEVTPPKDIHTHVYVLKILATLLCLIKFCSSLFRNLVENIYNVCSILLLSFLKTKAVFAFIFNLF